MSLRSVTQGILRGESASVKAALGGGLPVSQTVAGRAMVLFVKLDADEPSAQLLRRYQGRSRTTERIEDHAAGLRERADQRLQRLHRLLRRVQLVAGILPVEDVRHRRAGERRPAPKNIDTGVHDLPSV